MRVVAESGSKKAFYFLICFIMVLTAFLSQVFLVDVGAVGEEKIDVYVYSDLKKTKGNMHTALSDVALNQAKTINIIITEDILISPDEDCVLGVLGMGNGYFFDFTDARFEGKTISIKSNNGVKFKILNQNDSMGFLKARNCTVILENIVLDGGGIYKNGAFESGSVIRTRSFIDIDQRGEKIAALNLNQSSVNNCVCEAVCGGAISSKKAVVSLDKNSSITNCSVFDDSDVSGGAIDLVEGMFVMNGKSFITGCSVHAEEDGFGGAISMKRGTVVLRGNSYITNCSVGTCENACGGAVFLAGGMLSLNENSYISNCVVSADQGACGGAICSKGGTINTFGGDITTCISNSHDFAFGGGIYLVGGSLRVMGKSSITGCISKAEDCSLGGGIYVFEGELNLQSGKILNCLAKNHGDAVYVGGSGKYSAANPNGDLIIGMLSRDNSHNSDARILGYLGIYKEGIKPKGNGKK